MKVARSFQIIKVLCSCRSGGAVTSWLVRSTPDQAVQVRAPAGEHCVVFFGKTLYSYGASLHPGV